MWEDEYFYEGDLSSFAFIIPRNIPKSIDSVKWKGVGTIWKTSDGTSLAIWQMSNRHLMNTIKMLQRKEYNCFKFVAPKYIEIMYEELRNRGIYSDKQFKNTRTVLKNL